MTANFVLLEKITVGAAGASSVTFSGIPQTGYTDLVVKSSARGSSGSFASLRMTVNGATTNYSSRRLYGDGSSAASDAPSSPAYLVQTPIPSASETANTFSNSEYYIPNYAGSTNKSISFDSVGENNATTAYDMMVAGLWSQTTAVSSISLFMSSGDLAANSTFYLYGVAKLGTTPAIVPYATGGDTIMTDGTYWYHTFLSSGTFTPAKALSCDYLVVAGGGAGGGGNNAGGGGAGGLRSTVTATGGGGSLESKLSLASGTGYTVTIGAGGAGATANIGANGSNSVFSTITSTGGGGGRGGDSGSTSGANGGSGGGNNYVTVTSPSSGTANQGYAGGVGDGVAGPNYQGGGGGGAGEAGNTDLIGYGGDGVAVAITGSSVTYAGGGGGGMNSTGTIVNIGGDGGGGNGANNVSTAAISGTANRGGGGGGATNANPTSGSGGSGVVIVRYAV